MELKYFINFNDLRDLDSSERIAGLRFDKRVQEKNADGSFSTVFKTKYISEAEADQYAKSEDLKIQFLDIEKNDENKKNKIEEIAKQLNGLRMERKARPIPNLSKELYKLKTEMEKQNSFDVEI